MIPTSTHSKLGARIVIVITVASMLAGAVTTANAQQNYPVKALRFISPYPAGGTTDIMARLVGPKLTEAWGQPVIVDNRPGGNTVIGTEAMVKAAPDGYTLLSILSSHVIVPNLAPTPYDVIKDFAAIATIANTQLVLVIHPSVPARNLQQFIAFAKRRPGQLNYGSGGGGTVTHLAGEYFNMQAGVKTQHIPYKGSIPALTDTVGGQVQMYYSPPIVAIGHIKSGRLIALATTGETRLAALPAIPTAGEAGLKGFELNVWYGFLAQAATPRPIIDKLSSEITKILALPDIREKLSSQGMEPFISTPEQFATRMKNDYAKFASIIKTAKIKLEQ
jgi:tripartite-type tricarboxylate transporter receptor subunit TctC